MQLREQGYRLQEMARAHNKLKEQQRKLEGKLQEEQQKLDYLRTNQRKQQKRLLKRLPKKGVEM